MKLIEYILSAIVAILFFWLLNGEFTSRILFTFFAMLLSFYYYIFSFAIFNGIKISEITKSESYKLIEVKSIIVSIIAGWAFSTIVIGIIFKTSNWSFANPIIIGGLIANTGVLVYSIIKYLNVKSNFYLGIIIRGMIYGGFAVSLYMLPKI